MRIFLDFACWGLPFGFSRVRHGWAISAGPLHVLSHQSLFEELVEGDEGERGE